MLLNRKQIVCAFVPIYVVQITLKVETKSTKEEYNSAAPLWRRQKTCFHSMCVCCVGSIKPQPISGMEIENLPTRIRMILNNFGKNTIHWQRRYSFIQNQIGFIFLYPVPHAEKFEAPPRSTKSEWEWRSPSIKYHSICIEKCQIITETEIYEIKSTPLMITKILFGLRCHFHIPSDSPSWKIMLEISLFPPIWNPFNVHLIKFKNHLNNFSFQISSSFSVSWSRN